MLILFVAGAVMGGYSIRRQRGEGNGAGADADALCAASGPRDWRHGRSLTRSLGSTGMFWTKLPLPPLANGERDYWAMLKVDPPAPIHASEETDHVPTPPQGYFQNFGIRTKGDIRFKLTDIVGSDLIIWSESEVTEMDPKNLDPRIKKYIKPPNERGIWYASHKVFIIPAKGSSAA